jgi:hypothetical protein
MLTPEGTIPTPPVAKLKRGPKAARLHRASALGGRKSYGAPGLMTAGATVAASAGVHQDSIRFT